ncbi:MAG TPA: hypothetical protein VFW25_14465 [Silvibacterium sp.]|nr:hypothetical protein [Silvibacterium sp.]
MNNKPDPSDLEPCGEFAASVRDFRSAVTHVADRETARPVPADWLAPARKRRRSEQQRVGLAWACAVLLSVAAVPFSSHLHHNVGTHSIAQTASAPAPESDTALLEQVDTDISASVPSSLAPLAELDNWNAEATNTSRSSSGNGTPLANTENTNVAQ